MTTRLYRVHLADGGVRLEGGARYLLEVLVAEAVAAHGRSREWAVVAVSGAPSC